MGSQNRSLKSLPWISLYRHIQNHQKLTSHQSCHLFKRQRPQITNLWKIVRITDNFQGRKNHSSEQRSLPQPRRVPKSLFILRRNHWSVYKQFRERFGEPLFRDINLTGLLMEVRYKLLQDHQQKQNCRMLFWLNKWNSASSPNLNPGQFPHQKKTFRILHFGIPEHFQQKKLQLFINHD